MIGLLLKKLKIPAQFVAENVIRTENCRLCGEKHGKLISVVDYWDIKTSSIIKCEKCGLSQLDPMLTDAETSKGCLAYYIEESLRCSLHEQKRNLLRNFRRGVVFAYSLKKRNIVPENILEFGPGSGYFLQGIKFVFPKIKITVLDINQEILTLNEKHHQYETIKATPEKHIEELKNKFDLIIARDIIEHVSDISKMLQNVYYYSKPNGLFHFITPNGHEDVWKHYLTYKFKKQNSELLINHVNYFDGKGLLEHLQQHQFSNVDYYTYSLKSTRKGYGWKEKTKLMSTVSTKKESDTYINDKISELQNDDFNKEEILSTWYINDKTKFFTYLVCLYHQSKLFKVNPIHNIGHEIHGLFKIKK